MSDQLSTDRGALAPEVEETRVMRGIRWGLIVLGVGLLAWGAYVMLDTVRVTRLPGVALWIIAATVLHDAILAPIVLLIGILLRRGGQRVGGTVVVVVQGFIVVGSIVSLIVVPAIVAINYRPANPTVLPLNYGLNLAIFWLVLAVLAAGISAWLYSRTKRTNERPDTRHS
ncbi:hypothetical protein [Cryobacterium psychrophilum]|uniref:Uncharacterized protein n=1 Tax=Cryobacterium psychrophilum TaxID=41988 RepID=A0A4Y8KRI2_9MICO|nr:hypothetical protein [Cryobacterium psychrophilum]TDW30724.1 hypothetical protein EDD25_2494 [Cryobacterium psychrophilum]TFD76597.1 hypothetical protein E3T53_13115 [Cryobacterium psychrophilum]